MRQNNLEEYRGRRFSTIVADPPWAVYQTGGFGAAQHYPILSIERIKSLPVRQLATDDAHCWLWVTNATLRRGYTVLESWGFVPRSPLTWVKPQLGLGTYLRNATEHLLLGTRGSAPVRFRGQPTWTFAPVQDRNQRPQEVFAIIERLSPGPYLELFARRRPPSKTVWAVWGSDVDSDVVIPGFPVPSDEMNGTRVIEGGE